MLYLRTLISFYLKSETNTLAFILVFSSIPVIAFVAKLRSDLEKIKQWSNNRRGYYCYRKASFVGFIAYYTTILLADCVTIPALIDDRIESPVYAVGFALLAHIIGALYLSAFAADLAICMHIFFCYPFMLVVNQYLNREAVFFFVFVIGMIGIYFYRRIKGRGNRILIRYFSVKSVEDLTRSIH